MDIVELGLILIVVFPLLSFLILFFFGKKLKSHVDWIAIGFTGLSFLVATLLLLFLPSNFDLVSRFEWFKIFYNDQPIFFTISTRANMSVFLMLVIVTLISLLVNIYSVEYMKGKMNYIRYFPYLNLFTFSMLGIVISDNLLVTFMFWELVGFSSYLLIGFWFEKKAAVKASKKAFLFNRVGDIGFIIGLMACYAIFGTFELGIILNEKIYNITNANPLLPALLAFGIFAGCAGKSAQFPLHVWLPHAMEGPTPVSALLHAATMVAAGIYLLFKTYFLLTPDAKEFIAIIGATTCLLGAIPALFQNDIKKVLAYSTISQLGYMVIAIGTNSKEAAMFHLTTHAFFKACLFLSVGAVIHHMHHIKTELFRKGEYSNFDSQDMRFMGGLWKIIPIPFYCYLISCLSLIGVPLFSGFLSKELILAGAFAWAQKHGNDWHILVPLSATLTVFITSVYMMRQLVLVFFGDFKLYKILGYNGHLHSVKEDRRISIPLVILAFASFFFLFSTNPLQIQNSTVLEWIAGTLSFDPGHSITITTIALLLSLAGGSIAIFLCGKNPGILGHLTRKFSFIHTSTRFLKSNYGLDTFYFKGFVKGGEKAAAISNVVDRKIFDVIIHTFAYIGIALAHIACLIDRYVVDGLITLGVFFTKRGGKISKALQMGSLQNYFLAMILAIIALLIIYL